MRVEGVTSLWTNYNFEKFGKPPPDFRFFPRYQPDNENSERDTTLEDDHKGEPGKPELPELLIVFVFPLRPRWVEISRISLVNIHRL